MTSDLDNFMHERFRQSEAAVLWVNENAHASNVPFPAAQLLVQRGVANDLLPRQSEEGQIAAQIDVLAPITDDGQLGDAMLDKHALALGNCLKKLVKVLLISLLERAKRYAGTVLERNLFREFL
jgi:hypothetical protein